MASSVFGALLSGLLATAVIATPYAAFAQDAPKADVKVAAKADSTDDAKAEAKTEDKAKRPLTAQQLKLKDCGAKWQEEKKTKGVKGLEAWNKFRSDCMKS
jgi:Ni/Co efflux regulator RcnB